MSRLPFGVIAGLDPAIHLETTAAFACQMDARVKPAHDGGEWGGAVPHYSVIPGRARSVRNRNLAVTSSGFRVCAAGAAHPEMMNASLFGAATARREIA
uniref:Uncharacterized protein n=1 Tax=Rhodopseudomonas palustris (strain BisA53) TaxID=316055 RepID=Q07Q41_RHOP5